MLANVSDSGSNNFTLAREMHRQLYDEGLRSGHHFRWKPKTMSIRCFCHKMGLIVKAGLDALGLKPQRIRHSMLGRFPPVELMASINEEDEPSGSEQVESTEIDEDSDGSDVDDLESVDSNDVDSNADEEVADQDEEEVEPSYYKNRKAAYLLGDTYMMQLTKDVSFPFF